MAIRLPDFGWQWIRTGSTHPGFINRSDSLSQSRRSKGTQIYSGVLRSKPLKHNELRDLDGFMDGLHGQVDPFEFELPLLSTARGTVANSAAAMATTDAGYTEIIISGTPGATVKRGDYLTFNGFTKVYRAREDLTLDSSGSGTLKLVQNLRNAIPAGTAITMNGVVWTAIATAEKFEQELSPGLNVAEIEWEELLV